MNDTTSSAQYSKKKILFLWLLVALPMVLMKYIIYPTFKDIVPMHPGIFFWWLMIGGMMWQFILSVIILKKELGTLTKEKLKERLWLRHPVSPKTGKTFKRGYLWVIPIIVYAFLIEQFGFFDIISDQLIQWMPFLGNDVNTTIQGLMVPEFVGAWYLVVIAFVSSIFNYLLGEELFFRGILLPKMGKAFGKWDWVVNGILFAGYHLHKISEVPIIIVGSIFYSLLNRRYRSFYPGLIIHGIEAVPLFLFIILFVSGIMSL